MTRKKDPAHIPKPLNAFLCFRRAFSKQIDLEKLERLRQPQSGPSSSETGDMQQKHVSMRAGAAWNSLSAEEQAPYILEAAQLKKLHELKYPWLHTKSGSAGKKAVRISKGAARKRGGGKGRKARASDNLTAILDGSSASSSRHSGYDARTDPLHPMVPSHEFLPVPTWIRPFDCENGWSMPSSHIDILRSPTPALTPSHGLSPSPAPSDLYGFSPSANVSRVASPVIPDFTSDGTFHPDFSHPPAVPFIALGDDFLLNDPQLYGYQPAFNDCAPLVPHHLGHVAYPSSQAALDGVFPGQFASRTIPAFDPMSLGTEPEVAQADYPWLVELVDRAPLVPAVDVASNRDRQQLQLLPPIPPRMSDAQYLDWLFAQMASFPPCNDAFLGSSDL